MFIDKNSKTLLTICQLYVAPIIDVSSFIDGSNRFCKTITFKPGKNWREIYITPASALFAEKEKEEDAGNLVEQSLKFTFPGEDTDTTLLLEQLERQHLIVLMSIDDGFLKVFGSLDNGARLKRSSQITPKGSATECEIICSAQQFSWKLEI